MPLLLLLGQSSLDGEGFLRDRRLNEGLWKDLDEATGLHLSAIGVRCCWCGPPYYEMKYVITLRCFYLVILGNTTIGILGNYRKQFHQGYIPALSSWNRTWILTRNMSYWKWMNKSQFYQKIFFFIFHCSFCGFIQAHTFLSLSPLLTLGGWLLGTCPPHPELYPFRVGRSGFWCRFEPQDHDVVRSLPFGPLSLG